MKKSCISFSIIPPWSDLISGWKFPYSHNFLQLLAPQNTKRRLSTVWCFSWTSNLFFLSVCSSLIHSNIKHDFVFNKTSGCSNQISDFGSRKDIRASYAQFAYSKLVLWTCFRPGHVAMSIWRPPENKTSDFNPIKKKKK